MTRRGPLFILVVALTAPLTAQAARKVAESQPAEPGDEMIHAWLSRLAVQLDGAFVPTLPKGDEWDKVRGSGSRNTSTCWVCGRRPSEGR